MSSSGFNPYMEFANQGKEGISGIISGLFSDSGAPYEAAQDQYQKWADKSQAVQNPFLNAGKNAIGGFQDWLKSMQDPSSFINNLMGKYNESPWAKFQQQQAMRAGTNAASASGMTGSTPFAQALQQNASNISSQDLNQWLQNVLGINTQFGSGQKSLVDTGQTSANALTNMYGNTGNNMAEAAYGKKAGENQDTMNTVGGVLKLFGI